jgi:hypothetical protein
MEPLSVTQAVRQSSDLMNRVCYQGAVEGQRLGGDQEAGACGTEPMSLILDMTGEAC